MNEDNLLTNMDEEALLQFINNNPGVLEQYLKNQRKVWFYFFNNYQELIPNCFWPVATQQLTSMLPTLALCLLLNCLAFFKVNRFLMNILNIISGLGLVYYHFQELGLLLCLFAVFLYLVVFYTLTAHKSIVLCIAYLTMLITCELLLLDPEVMHQKRALLTLIFMKILSIAFDFESLIKVPSMISQLAYVFHPASIQYGPWISYSQFDEMLHTSRYDIKYFVSIIYGLVLSIVLSVFAFCIADNFLGDLANHWFLEYFVALAFRTGHYSACITSSFYLVAAGIKPPHNELLYPVTYPMAVEVPRSLVDVVTNWNLPMHVWLKKYVFKESSNYFKWKAIPIFITYFISSVFHGLNFQLSAVLLSLGFYTYIEFNFRIQLASHMDACVLSRKCPRDCKHRFKWNHFITILTNIGFVMLAIFHLIYLGMPFTGDEISFSGYNMAHTLERWGTLRYSSHLVAVFTLLLCNKYIFSGALVIAVIAFVIKL